MSVAPLSPVTLSDQDLLTHLRRAVESERHATTRLIALLMELDERRLHLGEGCSSLFTYCTRVLHLSEHAAYGHIEAARATRRYPVILELLTEGAITLPAVCLLAPHLTPDNHRVVLESARHKSRREVEQIVALLCPRLDATTMVRRLPAQNRPARAQIERQLEPRQASLFGEIATAARVTCRPAKVQALAAERYKIQFTVARETSERLRRVQDLMRHTIPNGDPAAIFERALALLFARESRKRCGAANRPRAAGSAIRRSRYAPAAVRRAVWARDEGRCAFKGTSGGCTETGFLEFHHVVPFADGGQTTVENVELRCRAHNAYEANQWFGPWRPPVVREARAVYGAHTSHSSSSRSVWPPTSSLLRVLPSCLPIVIGDSIVPTIIVSISDLDCQCYC